MTNSLKILQILLAIGLSAPVWGLPEIRRGIREPKLGSTPPSRAVPDSLLEQHYWGPNRERPDDPLRCICVRCTTDGYANTPVTFGTGMSISSSEDHDGMCMHDLSAMPVIEGAWKCNGGAYPTAPSCP